MGDFIAVRSNNCPIRTLLSCNAISYVSMFYESLTMPTHFQKVGLNAMLAADTVAL